MYFTEKSFAVGQDLEIGLFNQNFPLMYSIIKINDALFLSRTNLSYAGDEKRLVKGIRWCNIRVKCTCYYACNVLV